ncbi:sorbose reductase sou1 [Peniophora sp. CONT]|nr:sorbose reductase sou1 [Peniophora sp. CONT]
MHSRSLARQSFRLRPAAAFSTSSARLRAPTASPSPLPGVATALAHASRAHLKASPPHDVSTPPQPTLAQSFSLQNRIALVSGANRGLGLEMALALAEAGAKVFCVDLAQSPGAEFKAVESYLNNMREDKDVEALGGGAVGSVVYKSADVTDQQAMWKLGESVGNEEGRMDVCVAAAGILRPEKDVLGYDTEEMHEVFDVNVHGVLHTAQAAGRQMARFGNGGSIILIASMSGSLTNRDMNWVSYNSSKSAVLQMGRSMSCELGPRKIRVNTLSPGHIYTSMTAAFLDKQPALQGRWESANPLGRLGRPDELRGVTAWLASDASTFCTGSDILVSGGHHAW